MPSERMPDRWAARVLAHARSVEPTLGTGRLICVDGLTGAGKTTLAAELSSLTGGVVVHSDDLLHGWAGLPGLGGTIDNLLRPLAVGRPTSWRRWDWPTDEWAETRPLAPSPWLIIDGVGAGAAAYDDLITTLVWVEADRGVRLERSLRRDGSGVRDHLVRWLDDESALHARERTRERADIVLVS